MYTYFLSFTIVVVYNKLLVNLRLSPYESAEMIKAEIFPRKGPEAQESCHRHLKDLYVLHEGCGIYPF